jgi:hypothetical protein
MENSEQQLRQVQLTIEQAKASIERMKKLQRLFQNEDFQDIINEGYFVEEAARLVGARADANIQGKEQQRHINLLIDGVGALRHYFSNIERWGHMAEDALKNHEETREEILREQLESVEVGAQV